MGVFGGISNAKYSEGGVYLGPGVFRLRVEAVKYLKTRTQKDAFCVEFNVLESSNPQHLPGSSVTWMVTLDKEPALGNIKQFLSIALVDLMDKSLTAAQRMDQITEEICNQAVSEANPLKGRIVRVSASVIKTKANRDFTKIKYIEDSAGHDAVAKEHAANG